MSKTWIVTYDHLDKVELEAIGAILVDEVDIDVDRCTVNFRLYDDDGILYYEGRMCPNCDFEPLDDYGTPNAGCTRIDVQSNNGQWQTL